MKTETLTKLEYYTAISAQGMLANPGLNEQINACHRTEGKSAGAIIAKWAKEQAMDIVECLEAEKNSCAEIGRLTKALEKVKSIALSSDEEYRIGLIGQIMPVINQALEAKGEM